MRRLKSYIRVDNDLGFYEFDFVTNVEVVSSWDLFTDTAKITIPKRLKYRKDGEATEHIVTGAKPIFKRGDAITVKLGYHPNPTFGEEKAFNTIFTGFISEISPKRPIVILCEDYMWKLKQIKIDKYESDGPVNLLEVLQYLNWNYVTTFAMDVKAVDMNIGETIINNVSYAKFLDYLKRTYGLVSYMKGTTLYCGFATITQQSERAEVLPDTKVAVEYGKDLISTTSLNYKIKDDIRISVKAYSLQDDNSRLEASAGDEDGDARTLYYYNIEQEALDIFAKESVDKFKYTGYRGSFTIFIFPMVRHGNSVEITNKEVPDQDGEYLVKQVKTTFGTSGGRQEIFLDRIIA